MTGWAVRFQKVVKAYLSLSAGSTAPLGLSAVPTEVGEVSLDWTDNTVPDLAGYTVYRSASSGSGDQVIATSLTSSEYVDNTTGLTNNYDVITAWNTGLAESLFSREANAVVNRPPTFSRNPTILAADAVMNVAYNGNLSEFIVNLDTTPVTFTIETGPTWLNVATDGVLSGTPGIDDLGGNRFKVHASFLYGSHTVMMEIDVFAPHIVYEKLQIGRPKRCTTAPRCPLTTGQRLHSIRMIQQTPLR
ncbi:MAG: hypothetical protein ACI8Z5_001932 [Lentimonas sp.]|jgi:hypothetical protein